MNKLPIFTNHNAEVIALKKSLILLGCAAALVICAALLPSPSGERRQGEKISASSEKNTLSYSTSNAPSSQGSASAAEALTSGADLYIVREYEGHIGVYRDGAAAPFREYSTDVSVLPKADQSSLRQGKVLHSMAEVEKLMEDYDG